MSAQQVSKLLLERYLAGDLDGRASARVQKQLAENPELQKQLELLSQEQAMFLAQNPATTFAAAVMQRANRAKSGWSFSDIARWVLAPTMVVALVAGVFVLMPLREGRRPDSLVGEPAREAAKLAPAPMAAPVPVATPAPVPVPQPSAYAKPPPELARLDHSSAIRGAPRDSARLANNEELSPARPAPALEHQEKKSAKRQLSTDKAKDVAPAALDDLASVAPTAAVGSGLASGAVNDSAGGAGVHYAKVAPAAPAPPATPSFAVDLRSASGAPLGSDGGEGQLLSLRVRLPEPGMVVVVGVGADGARQHYAGSNTRRLNDSWFNARFRLAPGQVGEERIYVVFARDELNLDQLLYGQPSDAIHRQVFIVNHHPLPSPATNTEPAGESKPDK